MVRRGKDVRMGSFTRTEQPITGVIVIHVEAASLSSLRWTLDPGGRTQLWSESLIRPNEVEVAAATSVRETATALIRSAIEHIQQCVPSLEVGELTMRPEPMESGNAEVVASGPATFLASEWDTTKRWIVEQLGG